MYPRLTIFVLLAVVVAGCAGTIGSAAGAVPRPVIEQSLDTLDDPETQRAIADVLSSPEYRDATRALLGNVTDGALDALSEEERRTRLGELTDAFVAKMSESLGEAMRRDLAPAIATVAARTMDRAITEALSEDNRALLAQTVAEIARGVVVALAASLREELAPALRDLLEDEEVKQAIGGTAREISREIIIGLDDGFREIERRDERGARPDTILSRVQDFANEGVGLMQIGLIALAGVAAVLAIWLVFLVVRSRSAAAENRRREAAVLSLLEAVKSAERKPWGAELRGLLRESFRDNERAEYLRQVLRQNRHLRLADIDEHEEALGNGRGPAVHAGERASHRDSR
jgi:hypothetical protein